MYYISVLKNMVHDFNVAWIKYIMHSVIKLLNKLKLKPKWADKLKKSGKTRFEKPSKQDLNFDLPTSFQLRIFFPKYS